MQNQVQQEAYDQGYYEKIAHQYEAVHGDLPAAAEGLIKAAAHLEVLRLKASADIDTKGLRETVRNGKQAFLRENKSLGQMLKLISQQTSILQALKLLPSRRSASSKDEDDEGGDDKDELDDY